MADTHQHVTETSVDDLTTTEAVDPTDVSPYEEGQNRVVSQRISVFGTLGYDDEPHQEDVYDDFPERNMEQGDAYDALPQRTHSDVYQDTYQATSPEYEVYEEGKEEKDKPKPKYVRLTFARQIIFGVFAIVATMVSIITLVTLGVTLAGLSGDLDNFKNESSSLKSFYQEVETIARNSGFLGINEEIASLKGSFLTISKDVDSLNTRTQDLIVSLEAIEQVVNDTNENFQMVKVGLEEVRNGTVKQEENLIDAQQKLNSSKVVLEEVVKKISPLERRVQALE